MTGDPWQEQAAPASRIVEPAPFWYQFASCRPEYADRPLDQWVALFFPTDSQSGAFARAICAECPAQDACLDQAITNREKFGVWGGAGQRERRRLNALTRPA